MYTILVFDYLPVDDSNKQTPFFDGILVLVHIGTSRMTYASKKVGYPWWVIVSHTRAVSGWITA